MRQRLFALVPDAEAKWRQFREDYVAGIKPLELAGYLVVARKHALRTLQFLPESDPKVCPSSPPPFCPMACPMIVVALFIRIWFMPPGRPPPAKSSKALKV